MPFPTIEADLRSAPEGAILFDAGVLPQASMQMFEPAFWGVAGTAERGGRGEVWFVEGDFGAAVLRHYRRGGAVARLNRDSYLWTGAERSRSFAEFRLLQQLRERQLPVPAPIAARYLRHNPLWYRADLLMQCIPAAHSLAEVFVQLLDEPSALLDLAAVLARFHAAGVDHADLNAHNILRDGQGQWWLIDFDRGRLRAADLEWPNSKIQRLARSLRKLGLLDGANARAAWQSMVDTHTRLLAKAAP